MEYPVIDSPEIVANGILSTNSVGKEEIVTTGAIDHQNHTVDLDDHDLGESPEASECLKRRRGGEDDLNDRGKIRKLKTGIEKLKEIMKLKGQLKSTACYTENARNFINKTLNPVTQCLENHHDGDMDSFIKTWGDNFSYSRFYTKCKGKENESCKK